VLLERKSQESGSGLAELAESVEITRQLLLCHTCSAQHQASSPDSPHIVMPIAAVAQEPAEYSESERRR